MTPEPARPDPESAHDDVQEVGMATMQFGDTTPDPEFDSLPSDDLPEIPRLIMPEPLPDEAPAAEAVEEAVEEAVDESADEAADEPADGPADEPDTPLLAEDVAEDADEDAAEEDVEEPADVSGPDMRNVPLGTLVFRAGLVAEEELEEALQAGTKTGKRLGEVLIERGWVSETDIGRLLAAQKGLPFLELDSAAIDPTAPPLLSAQKARLHGALPIGFEDGVPVVAVTDPSNHLVVENVRRALACEPHLVVVTRDALQRAIAEAYGAEVAETPASPALPAASAPPPAANGGGVWLSPPAAQPPAGGQRPEQPLVQPRSVAPTEPSPSFRPLETATPLNAVGAPALVEPPADVVEGEAGHPEVDPAHGVSWSVVLRLRDGERIEIGSFASEGQAKGHAHGVVLHLAGDRGWPFYDGRFLRPDAVLSVDLVKVEGRSWLGSAERRAVWEPGR